LLVEHLARITQAGGMNAGLFEILVPTREATAQRFGFIVLALARNSTYQIEHAELRPRIT